MIQKSSGSSDSAGTWGRHRRPGSRVERATWLARFERSGVGLAEFCHRHGLSISTLRNWRRQARRAATVAESKLVEVPAAAVMAGKSVATERSAAVGIRLPNRIELEIAGGVDPRWIGALIREALACSG